MVSDEKDPLLPPICGLRILEIWYDAPGPFEPKKSRKVAVGAPGRPFEVTKGVFFGFMIRAPHLSVQSWGK